MDNYVQQLPLNGSDDQPVVRFSVNVSNLYFKDKQEKQIQIFSITKYALWSKLNLNLESISHYT